MKKRIAKIDGSFGGKRYDPTPYGIMTDLNQQSLMRFLT